MLAMTTAELLVNDYCESCCPTPNTALLHLCTTSDIVWSSTDMQRKTFRVNWYRERL